MAEKPDPVRDPARGRASRRGGERACAAVRDTARWDAWLARGVPGDVAAHAAGCDRCRQAWRELERLRAGLGALAAETERSAIRIPPAVTASRTLAAIRADAAAAGAGPSRRRWAGPSRRRWPAAAAGLAGLAVAAAALVWWRGSGGGPVTARVDAPAGAVVAAVDASGRAAGSARAVRGSDIPITLPAVVRTSPVQRAVVRFSAADTPRARTRTRAPAAEAALWPGSALRIDRAGLALAAGGVGVHTDAPVDIRVEPPPRRAGRAARADRAGRAGRAAQSRVRVTAQGRLAIEVAPGEAVAGDLQPFEHPPDDRERASREEIPMQTLRRHRALAAATVAVVVLAGWATLRTGSDDTAASTATATIRGPGGAAVTADGDIHRFGLSPPELASLLTGTRDPGTASAASLVGERPPAAVAVWDEDRQLVLFSVPGEAIDADTGEPVPAFRISAETVASGAYGQAAPRSWSFHDRADGGFVLDGLGVGTWRLTVRAPGYAPLTQTLDLSDVTADPYVVAPLSRGARLTGQVVDWRGSGVSGAKVGLAECMDAVGLSAGRAGARTGCEIAETGADGRFSLDSVPEGEVFALRARHPRHGYATSSNLVRRPGVGEHVVIQLSGVVRIAGEVTRGEDRRPVTGAQVSGPDGARAVTDHNGYYEMLAPLEEHPQAFVDAYPGGPAYRGRIASYPDNRSARELVWVDAATHVAEARIDFRLEMEDGRLYGHITDAAGKPAAGVELDLRNTVGWAQGRGHETFPTRAVTDAGGRYQIDHVPVQAGYTVRYKPPGGDDYELLGYVNVPDESPVEASFRIPGKGSGAIRGRFVDAGSGETVALSDQGCDRLGARAQDGGVHYLPRCYGDGRFEFESLPPGGYVLHNRVAWMDAPVTYREQTVTVAPGQVLDDVRVAVEGQGSAQWRVRVLDRKRRFLSGVYLRYRDTSAVFTSNLDVGPDGTATFTLNRKYTEVFIDCPGYESARIDLSGRDPGQTLEVRLDRAAAPD